MPQCPNCYAEINSYRNPLPTVDIIIESIDPVSGTEKIVLICRKNSPLGWAIPGGFIDYGETAHSAAIREAKEETNLDIVLLSLLGVYSDPARDPRHHTISTVFVATSKGIPKAGDDATDFMLCDRLSLPECLVFDHQRIIDDYYECKEQNLSK